MNKPNPLCKCGHKKGYHDREIKSRLPFMDRLTTRFLGKPYKEIKHIGFCHFNNCNCRRYE